MKFNTRFTKSFTSLAHKIQNAKSNADVAKIAGKYIQPLVSYFDDDGLNLLDEDFVYGYILSDKYSTVIPNHIKVNKHWLYLVINRTFKGSQDIYKVALPTKQNILDFLFNLLVFSSKKQYLGRNGQRVSWQWSDKSRVSQKQYKTMRSVI